MPTINFSLKDLEDLVGKKLTIEKIEDLASYGKGELEGFDEKLNDIEENILSSDDLDDSLFE